MYGQRDPPEDPPCNDCMEVLLEENKDAGVIYQLVRGQVVTRHNGRYDQILDLNFQSIKTVMDLYEIKDQRKVFEKVRSLFFYFLKKDRAEA